MSVYVVISYWPGTPAAVLGGAERLGAAKSVADRGDSTAWEPWAYGPKTGAWRRNSTEQVGAWQEIVLVETTGDASAWNGSTNPVADMAAFRGKRLAQIGYPRPGRTALPAVAFWSAPLSEASYAPSRVHWAVPEPKGIPTVRADEFAIPVEDTWNRVRRMWMDTISERLGGGEIRCGAGAAKEWLVAAIADLPTMPRAASDRYSGDGQIGSFAGVPIIIDPDLPPDVLRHGDNIYVISEGRVTVVNGAGLTFPGLD